MMKEMEEIKQSLKREKTLAADATAAAKDGDEAA